MKRNNEGQKMIAANIIATRTLTDVENLQKSYTSHERGEILHAILYEICFASLENIQERRGGEELSEVIVDFVFEGMKNQMLRRLKRRVVA